MIGCNKSMIRHCVIWEYFDIVPLNSSITTNNTDIVGYCWNIEWTVYIKFSAYASTDLWPYLIIIIIIIIIIKVRYILSPWVPLNTTSLMFYLRLQKSLTSRHGNLTLMHRMFTTATMKPSTVSCMSSSRISKSTICL